MKKLLRRCYLIVIVSAAAVACSLSSPTQYSTPGGALFGVGVKTVPQSWHVTGMPYPAQCALGQANGHALPDRGCTPGSVDGEVLVPVLGTPGNVKGTICTPGWTNAARALPQELVPVLSAAEAAYGVRGQATLNWLVPLELGGSNDVSNLFPLPVSPNDPVQLEKARVDDTLNRAVCAGTIGLAAAQQAEAMNWTTALQQVGLGG